MAKPRPIPLYVRILFGVALGLIAGSALGPRAAPLGELGLLVIRLLKALATPLILFAILDTFLRTHIPARKGALLVALSALNAAVAVVIGLGAANGLRAGERWSGRMAELLSRPPAAAPSAPSAATLDPLKNVSGYVPESLVEPFLKNNVIAVVLLAVLLGLALRRLKDQHGRDAAPGLKEIEGLVHAGLYVFTTLLGWLVEAVPYAVFGVVAEVVGRTGFGVFAVLGAFLGTILLGLFLHAVVYYSLLLRTAGGVAPRRFFGGALDSIVTALSCGSSLATLPVTLRCLNDNLKVSPDSARLAACVGTNLNHAGIILYEAAAALFVSQAFGFHLGWGQQAAVALASVMAGIGIAGVPEAGLITLPLVLGAAGLPAEAVGTAIPLILPVDWIIGRCRAAANVTSDMTVAVILDRLSPGEEKPVRPLASAVL